jgi:hypothetical protein
MDAHDIMNAVHSISARHYTKGCRSTSMPGMYLQTCIPPETIEISDATGINKWVEDQRSRPIMSITGFNSYDYMPFKPEEKISFKNFPVRTTLYWLDKTDWAKPPDGFKDIIDGYTSNENWNKWKIRYLVIFFVLYILFTIFIFLRRF